MRIRITLGTLLCVALLVGCTRCLSPYEQAERDRQILEADARRAVEKEVAEANERAAKTNGITWVDVRDFRRVVFFVPKPKPKPKPEPWPPIDSDGMILPIIPDYKLSQPSKAFSPFYSPPDGATRHQWTDQYALAQRYIYHYTLEEIADVRHGPDLDHPYVATVRVRIKVEHQKAIAADAKPVPKPPAGMKRWKPAIGLARGFWGCRGAHLPNVFVPGEPSTEVTDPLGKRAVSLLKTASIEKRTVILRLTVTFSPQKGTWSVSCEAARKFPHPAGLTWEHGVPEELGIFEPSQERTTS